MLDQFVRGQIYGYVRANPGDCYSSIRDSLELSNGVVTYHLGELERRGELESRLWGRFKRYYLVAL